MNNIIIKDEKKIVLSNENSTININSSAANIVIESGKNILDEINTRDLTTEINIYLKENTCLNYYRFDKINKSNITINFFLENNSKLNFFHSIYSLANSNITITTNQHKNDSNSNIEIRGLTEDKGSLIIEANGIVKKDTKSNELLENIKVLTLNNAENKIIPNMFIETNETYANHMASLGKIDDSELFYLTSKGISKKSAIKLIKEGFLLKNSSLQFYPRIKELLKK